MLAVLPGRSIAPVGIELTLQRLHFLPYGFLCVFLQSRVQCGVYLQSVGVGVQFVPRIISCDVPGFAQHVQVLYQLLSEIGGECVG